MTSTNEDTVPPFAGAQPDAPPALDDPFDQEVALSTALVSVFRGKFCDFILPDRKTTTFRKHSVIYDVGDRNRTLFFLRSGFAKVGAITADGHEVIYDVRKGGDVIGELCASEQVRPDRAVALEDTVAIAVPFEEVMRVIATTPDLIAVLLDLFCRALKEAYAQVTSLASDDTLHRLVKVLIGLAAKIGQGSGPMVEIPTYLTQEEIAEMVAARRERISTALNSLRRQGMLRYSPRGRLLLDVRALESCLP